MSDVSVSPAPRRRRLAAGLMVLAWCAAVAIAATAAWLVVDRAGLSLLGGSGPGLLGGVAGAPHTSSTTTPVAPGQTSSLTTSGGRVTAACTPAGLISLKGAIPVQGWRVEASGTNTKRLEVEFRSGSRKVEVQGACRAGVAVLTIDKSGKGSPSPTSTPSASTDDHGGNGGGGDSGGGSGFGGSGSSGSGGSGSGKSG